MIPINVTVQFVRDSTKEARRVRLAMDSTVAAALAHLSTELSLPGGEYHLMRGRQIMASDKRLYEEEVQEGDILQIVALDPNATMLGKVSLHSILNRVGGAALSRGAPLPDNIQAALVAPAGAVFPLVHVRATIGRADSALGFPPEVLDADLTPLDPNRTISRPHALIVYRAEDDSFTIRDLYSQLGVLVNGQKAPANTAQPIRDGDTVQLGDVVLQFRVGR